MDAIQTEKRYGLRPGAEEFPLMVVVSIIYPCNFGCPMCPYTDSNSDLRKFYHEHGGDLMPVELWQKMADECGHTAPGCAVLAAGSRSSIRRWSRWWSTRRSRVRGSG